MALITCPECNHTVSNKKGFESATLNLDCTVTCTMSYKVYKALLEEISNAATKELSNMASKDISVKEIKARDNFTHFSISTYKPEGNPSESKYITKLNNLAIQYNNFTGSEIDSVYIEWHDHQQYKVYYVWDSNVAGYNY